MSNQAETDAKAKAMIQTMARLTAIRYQLSLQMKALDTAWRAFRELMPPCPELAPDGKPCLMFEGHGYAWREAGYGDEPHISNEEYQSGEARARDHKRPYTLSAGSPKEIPYGWGEMVPINLQFTDGDIIGSRVAAWVRPEDVWRFIPEVTKRSRRRK